MNALMNNPKADVPPVDSFLARLRAAGSEPKATGPDQWTARCPAHDDSNPSLSVARGDDGRVLLHCFAGCPVEAIVGALGMSMADLFPPGPAGSRAADTGARKDKPRAAPTPEGALRKWIREKGEPTAHWVYHEAGGAEAFRVFRFDSLNPETGGWDKTYRPVHRTPEGWVVGDPPGPLPLYRLPGLASADRVYVCEGEKCADLIIDLGLCATTSAHGARSPRKSDWSPLAGKEVVIVPDQGLPGDGYARAVAGLLEALDPRPTVRVVRLPGLADGEDIEQWLAALPEEWEVGMRQVELERLADSTPVMEPGGSRVETTTPADPDDVDRVPIRDEWPEPLDEAALYGLAGEFVSFVSPQTEADPVAILVQTLVAVGNLIGRSAYYTAEADRHYANLFAVVVGRSSKGRKGSSWGYVRRLGEGIDEEWAGNRLVGGLSSGEGLIWAVRDPVESNEPIREGKNKLITGCQTVIKDSGVEDKRLLVTEPEFAAVLKNASREGNNLSATVRQAWDTGTLRTLVKNSPNRATGAHISIIGHITRDEVRRYLTETESANGFANRFLWVCARRSQILPFGGSLRDDEFQQFVERFQEAAKAARQAGRVVRDREADRLWADAYDVLSEGRPGLLGAILGRAESQVLRLSLVYALLNHSVVIRQEHLLAALALWSYVERSARYIFGESLGDEDVDTLLATLRNTPAGLTRTEIPERVFRRNMPASRIRMLLTTLLEHGLARCEREVTEGPGRRPERWFAVTGPTNGTNDTN